MLKFCGWISFCLKISLICGDSRDLGFLPLEKIGFHPWLLHSVVCCCEGPIYQLPNCSTAFLSAVLTDTETWNKQDKQMETIKVAAALQVMELLIAGGGDVGWNMFSWKVFGSFSEKVIICYYKNLVLSLICKGNTFYSRNPLPITFPLHSSP